MLYRPKTIIGEASIKALVSVDAVEEVALGEAQEPVLAWPRVVEVATPWGLSVKVNLAAPVSPLWYPGLMASVVGQNGVLNEPSNGGQGVPPLPLRSEAGFPLFYALAGGKPIDTPSVCVGDQTFNSDAAAKDYLARVAADEAAKGGPRVDPRPMDVAKQLTPDTLAEWQALPDDDRTRGVWLNNRPGVARLLLNGGHMSHQQSSAYDNAAGGYKS